MKKSKLQVWGLIVVLILILGAIFGERVFAEQLHKDNMIASSEELSQKITEELMNGKESFRVYVKDMSESQLVSINRSLDGFFGHVVSYTILRKVNKDIMFVTFELEVSDNYYVYQNIVHDMPISDYVQAQVLAKKVEQIMTECESESEYQTVLNYHDYIVTHTEYGFIDGEESALSYKAYGALLRGQAVCNGYAEAMELLLLCSGFDTYMAVGNTQDGSHAWNIVKIDGEWYHVDTTYDDPVPDMGDEALHVYLNVNDDIMEKSHSWNESAYPECVSMDANYYKMEQKEFSDLEQLKTYIIQTISSESVYEVMLSACTPTQSDFESIIKETGTLSVSWQCYEDGDYSVYKIVFQSE